LQKKDAAAVFTATTPNTHEKFDLFKFVRNKNKKLREVKIFFSQKCKI